VPPGTVFVGRRPTGETFTPELARLHPDRDWILTRILWLRGRARINGPAGALWTGRHPPPGSADCLRYSSSASVTAPRLAVVASFANLASTPRV
jgi:hypothetical protein